jgi:uncharacterized protein (TIGR03492 family)
VCAYPALQITVLSNGYGEDSIGAALLHQLHSHLPEARRIAYPTVDLGNAYLSGTEGVTLLEPRQVMPSGGLLLHHPQLFWQDIKAGFLGLTLKQLRTLRQHTTDVLIVIGDVYALLLSSLVRTKLRFYYQSLISIHHRTLAPSHPLNRLAMERVTLPERLLIQRLCHTVYLRDEATAHYLQQRGIRQAKALGNPMLDAITGGSPLPTITSPPRIALLPGSRRYRAAALQKMLRTLEHLPEATGYLAWTGGKLPPIPGWQLTTCHDEAGLTARYQRGTQTVFVCENRFADVLCSCQLVLGTSGTAQEQAAALGLPVVSFPVAPYYTSAFLKNQKRLLGDALAVCDANSPTIAASLRYLMTDARAYRQASETGKARMGPAGGTAAITADIVQVIKENSGKLW